MTEEEINKKLGDRLETICSMLALFIDQFRMNTDSVEDSDLTIQKDYSTLLTCGNKLHEIKERRFR